MNKNLLACPACDKHGSHQQIIEAVKGTDHQTYAVFRCASCGTRFCPVTVEQAYSSYAGEFTQPTEDGLHFKRTVDKKVIDHELRVIQTFVPHPGRVLEIGFGDGVDLSLLADARWSVVGIEVTDEPVKYAQAAWNLNHLCIAGAEALPFTSETFDFVRMRSVIEHIVNPDKALHDVLRILKPGGIFYLDCPSPGAAVRFHEGFWNFVGRFRPRPPFTWFEPPMHIRWFPQKGIERLLERIGFDIVDIGTTYRGDPAYFPWDFQTIMGGHGHSATALNWKGRMELRLLGRLDWVFARLNRGSWLYAFARKPL